MQQERGREGGSGEEEDMKPNNQQQQQQQQQQQKCPRCESMNTKFCYYNNYSLSQPRYFCKTCRRYWTQGGTLRNVPVGGGCRKGKRARTTPTTGASDGALRVNKETNLVGQTAPPIPTFSPLGMGIGPYGGGFMPSLAASQSFSHPGMANIGKEDVLGVGFGGGSSSSSSLGLLMHGLNNIVPSLASQFGSQGQQSTGLFYHPIATNTSAAPTSNITSVMGQEESLIHSRGLLSLSTSAQGSSSSYQPLSLAQNHQGFMVSSNSGSSFPNVSDASLWSISTSTSATTTTSTTTAVGSSSVNPNQWNDLSGYGPPK